MKDIHFGSLFARLGLVTTTRSLSIDLLEDTLWIEHTGINLVWCNISLTNKEDFGRLTTTCRRLDSLDGFEELFGYP
jgi:hypothetical protein